MLKAWLRILRIELTSNKLRKVLSFGDDKSNFNIEVSGNKFLAAAKDNFIVQISNLTYDEIVTIISGEYYNVKIIAGYKNGNQYTLFDGGVLYVTNDIKDRQTNTVYIICASKAIAKYGQKKMNLTMNSGINMYSAIKFMCKRAGITDANIGDELKLRLIRDDLIVSGSVGTGLTQLFNSNDDYMVNVDSTAGSTVNFWSIARKASRYIKLNLDNILPTNGYPTLSSDGLSITLLPTFNFMPGDVICLDNALIDISVTSKSEALQASKATFFDPNGQYVILELSYSLQNRGSSFHVGIKARAMSLMTRLNLGVTQ